MEKLLENALIEQRRARENNEPVPLWAVIAQIKTRKAEEPRQLKGRQVQSNEE